jgi:hypothetical protein
VDLAVWSGAPADVRAVTTVVEGQVAEDLVEATHVGATELEATEVVGTEVSTRASDGQARSQCKARRCAGRFFLRCTKRPI